MIKRYNNLSFLFFIPGIILQVAGLVTEHLVLSPVLLLGGTALVMTGFGFYAKAKGRTPVWGLAGFLGFLELIVLACMKNRSGDPWNT